jgi:hypothetical protein
VKFHIGEINQNFTDAIFALKKATLSDPSVLNIALRGVKYSMTILQPLSYVQVYFGSYVLTAIIMQRFVGDKILVCSITRRIKVGLKFHTWP